MSAGDNTPLYDCPECGEQTVLPEVIGDDVVDLECPSCGHEGLVDVDDLCRYGRTVDPFQTACYSEWEERWPDEEKPNLQKGAFRFCEEHYDEYTSPLPLPDGAIGRCETKECTHAVFDESEEGRVICKACQDA